MANRPYLIKRIPEPKITVSHDKYLISVPTKYNKISHIETLCDSTFTVSHTKT